MADPLCTPADVAAVLGIAADGETTPRLTAFAAQASAFVRGYTGQTITLVADDEVTLRAPASRLLFLPETPVLDVATITINGGSPTLEVEDFVWSIDGVVTRTGGGDFGSRYGPVTVKYTHGHNPVPDDIAAATASIAARGYLSGPSVAAETIGAHTWRIEATGGLTRLEEVVLDRYRVKAAA